MNEDKIDYIFTYVDESDDNWYNRFKKYAQTSGLSISRNGPRYRSWGTLKYLLRGIAENLPFINNLYMIVESPTQVPNYINTDTVHVIYHNQIIPEEYLPTYNSNVIELFMYRIPGLSEKFIYGNDDMFPIGPLSAEDFFDGETPLIRCFLKPLPKKLTTYRLSLIRTLRLCMKHNNYTIPTIPIRHYVRSDHSLNPMLKSTWEMYHSLYEKSIKISISRFRKPSNITQELSNFHHFSYNETHDIKIPKMRNVSYFEFKHRSPMRFEKALQNEKTQILCMNDAGVDNYEEARKIICKMFEKKFPNKCKYEK